MKTTLLTFGIAKEILGFSSMVKEFPEGISVAEFRETLTTQYPEIKNLSSCLIAVNHKYADEKVILQPEDEIAIIPPVSGG